MTATGRRLDLRLAVPAAAAWLTALLTVHTTSVAVVVGAGAAVLAAAAGAVRGRVLAAAGLGAAAAAGATAIHVAALRHGPVPVAAAHHDRAEVTVRLVRDPVAITTRRGRRLIVADATVTGLGVGDSARPADAPVVLFAVDRSWLGLLPGQRVRTSGRFAPPRRGDTVSAVYFAHGPPHPVGRPPPWQRAAGAVRAALRRACRGLPADERGLVPGLVLGDVSAMPASLTTAFRTTGLTHLNAVSGENVAIVLGTVLALVRRVGFGRRTRVLLAGLALAGFVVLVRPTPSVLRAGVMGSLALAAVLAGRRSAPVPMLAAAVLGLVLVDPFLARSPGFALSVLATLAIVTLAPAWTERLARRLPRPVAAAVAVPAAAQLACTPVIVAVFGQLTPLAVPANLLAAPAVAPATIAGVAAALTSVVAPGVASLLAWCAAVPAGWLALVARGLARMPGAGATWPRGTAGLALLVAVGAAAAVVVRAARARRARGMLAAWPP